MISVYVGMTLAVDVTGVTIQEQTVRANEAARVRRLESNAAVGWGWAPLQCLST